MKFQEQAILLSAESTPYSFNGNEGVSHKIRLNIGGEIYKCDSSEEQVKQLKNDEGKTGVATVVVTSRTERLKIELESFEVEPE